MTVTFLKFLWRKVRLRSGLFEQDPDSSNTVSTESSNQPTIILCSSICLVANSRIFFTSPFLVDFQICIFFRFDKITGLMCGARFLSRELSSNKKLWRRGGNLHASLQRKIFCFQHSRNPLGYQCCWSGSACIRIKLKGFIHIRICINVISWIRILIHIKVKSWIRILISLQMTSHNVWKMSLFKHFFKV